MCRTSTSGAVRCSTSSASGISSWRPRCVRGRGRQQVRRGQQGDHGRHRQPRGDPRADHGARARLERRGARRGSGSCRSRRMDDGAHRGSSARSWLSPGRDESSRPRHAPGELRRGRRRRSPGADGLRPRAPPRRGARRARGQRAVRDPGGQRRPRRRVGAGGRVCGRRRDRARVRAAVRGQRARVLQTRRPVHLRHRVRRPLHPRHPADRGEAKGRRHLEADRGLHSRHPLRRAVERVGDAGSADRGRRRRRRRRRSCCSISRCSTTSGRI